MWRGESNGGEWEVRSCGRRHVNALFLLVADNMIKLLAIKEAMSSSLHENSTADDR